MEPLKVLIADDEQFATYYLRVLLSHYPNLNVIPAAEDGYQTLNLLHNTAVDVVFMDVLMPGLNGIDVLKQFNKTSALSRPLFIMHTAYEQFAYTAFLYKAFAYLLKPLSPALLHHALKDAYAVLQQQPCQTLLQPHPKLQFHVGNSQVLIEEHEIILLEAAGNYVCLRTRHQNIIIRETLKQLLSRLPPVFVQVHRSMLINLLHVKKVMHAAVSRVQMSDGTEVRLSRRFKLNWQALLQQDHV